MKLTFTALMKLRLTVAERSLLETNLASGVLQRDKLVSTLRKFILDTVKRRFIQTFTLIVNVHGTDCETLKI